MYSNLAFAALGNAALIHAQVSQVQGPADPPVLLNMTKASVLPVLPTPFSGILTEEGALLDQGPQNATFAGLAGPAVAQTNMPATTYTATLPATMFNPYAGGNITGTITGVGTSNGVQFIVNIMGLPPSNYGPFGYHIHGLPVPADGNCTATMAHLDPTNRGEYYPCPATAPQNCQAGDLAGKHGKISSSMFMANYVESFLSTDPSSPYFFGSGSIVIHTSNTTRLTCANFKQAQSGGGNSTSSTATQTQTVSSTATTTKSSTTGGSGTSSTSSPTTVPTAGASKVIAGAVGGIAVAFGISLFL